MSTFLVGIFFFFIILTGGCTKYPSAEEMKQLREAKRAAESLERKVATRESYKNSFENIVAQLESKETNLKTIIASLKSEIENIGPILNDFEEEKKHLEKEIGLKERKRR